MVFLLVVGMCSYVQYSQDQVTGYLAWVTIGRCRVSIWIHQMEFWI
jgi:hypothetical protein